MSQPKEPDSDKEEFQDALSDLPPANAAPATDRTNKMQEKEVDEIIKKQESIKLNDGDNNDDEAKDVVEQDILEDIISEEELAEREKTMSTAELSENKQKADNMKLEGNELFKNGDAVRAVTVYTEAILLCPSAHTKERAILYGNRAASKIKLDSKKSAIDDCTKALELWPDYLRVLLRRAKLYETEDRLDEALADYKRVNDLEPGHAEAREAMVRLPPIINERLEKQKEEMLSKLKDLGNMILKPFGLSTSNFQMQQDPNSGSYSINFNQK